MNRAVYIGQKPGNRSYLLHRGYYTALQSFGWKAEWLSHVEGASADLTKFDLIIHDAVVPENVLKQIGKHQILIALNGAGDDLLHYPRYADRFALITSSSNFFDDPGNILSKAHLTPSKLFRPALYYVLKYYRRFMRFAQPVFYREMGVRFMHLPFASDPELFHPIKNARKKNRWVFCGLLKVRDFVPALKKYSDHRGWSYQIIAPELKNTVDPMELNGIYNSTSVGVNEQHLMTFGRELNQRGFDYGMAGIGQITDMGYMCSHMYGRFCRIYSGKIASKKDFEYGYKLLEEGIPVDPDEMHTFFRKHHSFATRLAQMSACIGADLTLGKANLSEHVDTVAAWQTYKPLKDAKAISQH